MKINDCDAVILSGGQGTRIKSMLPPGTPKAMADINGRPFLKIYLDSLLKVGFESFIFSLGYGAERIEEFLHEHYRDCCQWICENEPLGNGGGLRNVVRHASLSEKFFVMNGDTLFGDFEFNYMLSRHSGEDQIVTSCKYNRSFVGVFLTDKRIGEFLEWEHREKFDMADLPLHGHSLILNTSKPFLDIGTPAGLFEAREKYK